jgi:CheY-like chemotaxis protein
VAEDRLNDLHHELMNPVAAILGFVQLAQLRGDQETVNVALAQIQVAAQQLEARITALVEQPLSSSDGVDLHGPVEPPLDHPRRDDGSVAARNWSVLIVDDDPVMSRLLSLTLAGHGFEVLEATDSTSALSIIATGGIDLVLLDWWLPPRSGRELLEAVRDQFPTVRVIVVTAELDPRVRRLAVQGGAVAFITKPFSPREICNAVEVGLRQVSYAKAAPQRFAAGADVAA